MKTSFSNLHRSESLDDDSLVQTFKRVLGLRYHVHSDRFEAHLPGMVRRTVLSASELLGFIATALVQRPDQFADSRFNTRRLNRLVGTLRRICVYTGDEPVQSLREFVSTRLVCHPGSDVTSGELSDAYQGFIRRTDGIALSPYEFHRQLPAIMKERFGIAKRHEILRPSPGGRLTKRNGWVGIGKTVGNDGTDTNDSAGNALSTAEQ